MAAVQNGLVNGHASGFGPDHAPSTKRFSDIPATIDIQVHGLSAEEAVELDLQDLREDPTELITVMQTERAGKNVWMTVALAYAKQHKVDHAIELLTQGLASVSQSAPKDKLALLSCLCWLYLWKSREAPRVLSDATKDTDIKTKDAYLIESTKTLNEASHINPSFPPLFLARGVLCLLRASLMPPAKPTGAGAQDHSERTSTLKQALQHFEDALRVSGGRNMMAVLGKARALYSMGRYSQALEGYQEVLTKAPNLTDPDPRIGIGCCLWNLGYKEDAKGAWERALELNPTSPIANVLLGLYFLQTTSNLPTSDAKFMANYKKAMTVFTQKSYKVNQNMPLTCATFGAHFLSMKAMKQAETLARKAIELTDVNAIASDGWYLLARKEHYLDDVVKATEYYRKADEARGGDARGYLPAKIGMAQLQASMNDVEGAKFRLEKIVQSSKNIEAIALLGTIYADEFFANQASGNREDKSVEAKKAISYLETVRMAWKDASRNLPPDSSILLNLARLYEADQREKSLQCLQQVEQMEIDQIPVDDRPDIEDEEEMKTALRENLPPQLLNNMGCFHYHAERYLQAREMFQTALNACVKIQEKEEMIDTDALVTSISFNLARTYEAADMWEEAKQIYEGLLNRHSDYTDASTRLAYIALRQSPTDEGPKMVNELYRAETTNLEVRSLYGWFLSKSKRRIMNLAEDPEQRHHKHTLQNYDKHDRYALTAMGNLHLICAREMRRDSESDREKRSSTYKTAVSFFDKAIQYDPNNAYAAQGLAIALAEEKKEYGTAIQILIRVRDTVKDASVYVNMGHIYAELKQYPRSIENYEAALAKDRGHDFQLMACLGRVWFFKGKQEKSLLAMNTALDYSKQALDLANDQKQFFRFNVAFVQFQIAQLVYNLAENKRTFTELQTASEGLDEALTTFEQIASEPNPPYPKNDIEQRANMGRNTMKRQLERALQSQKEYEDKNIEKLQRARELREAEMKKAEEERATAEEAAQEQRRRITEERRKIKEHDQEIIRKREEEERRIEHEEYSVDEETGEKRKRTKRKGGGKRHRRTEDDSDDGRRGSISELSGQDKPKKKRRLQQRKENQSKYKSSEIVVDSDDDDDDAGLPEESTDDDKAPAASDVEMGDLFEGDQNESDGPVPAISHRDRQKKSRAIVEDDEDEDEDENEGNNTAATTNGHEETRRDETPDEPAMDEVLHEMQSSPEP